MEKESVRMTKGRHRVICRTSSVEETKTLGEKMGKFMERYKGALAIALIGDLGTGKTHFSQGVARGFGFAGEVVSPTFALMNTYEVKRSVLYHFDLYRLDSYEELENIGFGEYTDRTKCLVEWANKFEQAMPEDVIWVYIDDLGENHRQIEFISTVVKKEDLEDMGGPYVFRN